MGLQYKSVPSAQTGVHSQLKQLYLEQYSGKEEIILPVDGKKYRVDVFVEESNTIIEIQRYNFGKPFYSKIKRLIKNNYNVVVVHPIAIRQNITRMKKGEIVGKEYSNRRKRNEFSFFEQLVSFRTKFVPEKMDFDLLLIREHVSKEFVGAWEHSKRSRYRVVERDLLEIIKKIKLQNNEDFLQFLPSDLPKSFTNKELALLLNLDANNRRKMRIAGWITYSMCNLGLLERLGKRGRSFEFSLNISNE